VHVLTHLQLEREISETHILASTIYACLWVPLIPAIWDIYKHPASPEIDDWDDPEEDDI